MTYSLGGLALIALVTAAAVVAFTPAPDADPLRVALAARVGLDGPLADSLRALPPDDLSPVERAALAGLGAERAVWVDGERVDLHEAVVPFYRARGLRAAWADPAVRDTALFALRDALHDGLDPADYRAEPLAALARALDAREETPAADTLAATFELALTDALFRYAEHAQGSRTDPVALYSHLGMKPRARRDAPADLAAALGAGTPEAVAQALAGLQPPHPEYRALRVALRRALDGTGPDSVSADLLRLNLERWRWMPDDLGDLHVLVDVPGYRMWVREADTTAAPEASGARVFRSVEHMDVVVGLPGRWQTPVMTDTMETIVFSPTWIVPASIQRESYGRVVPGLVKDPGPGNPMGRAKFLFPNDQAIYIHDTNSKWGFKREVRALSHGCVRAADPEAFAAAILTRTNGWAADDVAERFTGPWRTESVRVGATLPVHLTYFTAWADANGTVRLSPDVYRRDAALADALGLTL